MPPLAPSFQQLCDMSLFLEFLGGNILLRFGDKLRIYLPRGRLRNDRNVREDGKSDTPAESTCGPHTEC